MVVVKEKLQHGCIHSNLLWLEMSAYLTVVCGLIRLENGEWDGRVVECTNDPQYFSRRQLNQGFWQNVNYFQAWLFLRPLLFLIVVMFCFLNVDFTNIQITICLYILFSFMGGAVASWVALLHQSLCDVYVLVLLILLNLSMADPHSLNLQFMWNIIYKSPCIWEFNSAVA